MGHAFAKNEAVCQTTGAAQSEVMVHSSVSPCQSSLIFLYFMHGYEGCMHESKPYHHGRGRAQNCIACSTAAIWLPWQPLRQLQAHNSIAISANCAPGRPPIVRHNDCHLESNCTPALRPAHLNFKLEVPRRSQYHTGSKQNPTAGAFNAIASILPFAHRPPLRRATP